MKNENVLRKINLLSGLILSISFLSGCASLSPNKIVGDPSQVTVEDALKSIGTGLSEMRAAIGTQKTGLIPSEVTVNFKLAASATDSKKLTIDLSVPVGASATAKAGTDLGATSTGERSNEITIKFINVLTLNKDSIIQTKSSKDLGETLQILNLSDITPSFTSKGLIGSQIKTFSMP